VPHTAAGQGRYRWQGRSSYCSSFQGRGHIARERGPLLPRNYQVETCV
jgi:hypothetical protein